MCAEGEVELHLTNEGVVEYEDWGGAPEGVRSGDGGLWAVAGSCASGLRRASCADPDVFTPVGGTEASWGRSSVQLTFVVH